MKRAGDKIRELRNERKWSQTKLAEGAGISVGYVSDIENDTREGGTSIGMYQKIANALDVSLPWLLIEYGNSEILDSIIVLLADRPKEIQENALELLEVYLKGIDRQQSPKES